MIRRDRREHKIQAARLTATRQEIENLRLRHSTRQTIARAWEGTRKFRVDKKVAETPHCHSIYLVPHDGKPLPPFEPGQFLTFSLKLDDGHRPTVRCYSLSDQPHQEYYRCTIKKIPPPQENPSAPGGKVSTYFNEVVCESDLLDVEAPRGSFVLNTSSPDPVVLLARGSASLRY